MSRRHQWETGRHDGEEPIEVVHLCTMPVVQFTLCAAAPPALRRDPRRSRTQRADHGSRHDRLSILALRLPDEHPIEVEHDRGNRFTHRQIRSVTLLTDWTGAGAWRRGVTATTTALYI